MLKKGMIGLLAVIVLALGVVVGNQVTDLSQEASSMSTSETTTSSNSVSSSSTTSESTSTSSSITVKSESDAQNSGDTSATTSSEGKKGKITSAQAAAEWQMALLKKAGKDKGRYLYQAVERKVGVYEVTVSDKNGRIGVYQVLADGTSKLKSSH
ncbi:MAG TPA: hypothetical protein VGM95_02330 [Lactobacillaceae bacterium]|jgi:cytoskeletal protein RodZ